MRVPPSYARFYRAALARLESQDPGSREAARTIEAISYEILKVHQALHAHYLGAAPAQTGTGRPVREEMH